MMSFCGVCWQIGAGHIPNFLGDESYTWMYLQIYNLLNWKIQLHVTKAIWAKKNDRFILYNMDIRLEIVGTICIYLKFCGVIQPFAIVGHCAQVNIFMRNIYTGLAW
jgi:hypothetical protein